MLTALTRVGNRKSYASPASTFMVGCSATTQRDSSTAAAMATMESRAGHQYVKRAYANTTYTTFNLSNLIGGDFNASTSTSIRTTWLSWSPVSASLVSENTSTSTVSGFDPTLGFNAWKAGGYSGTVTGYGTETTKNITALRTIPDYHKVILTPWHEADGYGASGATNYDWGTNYSQFRKAFQVLADIIHAFGNPTWQVCLLLTAFGFKGTGTSSSYTPSNFWPAPTITSPAGGNAYVDVFGVDIYSEGSLDGSRWDSFSVSMGVPMDGAEAAAYQARYNGVGGWRQSDPNSGATWTNGVLGWMNTMGITKYAIGEVGVQLNHKQLSPTWPGARMQLSNTKIDWIKALGNTLAEWNVDPRNTAKCVGVCYFMSAGRTYAATDYLTNSLHNKATGARVPCTVTAASSSALPTTGNTTGDMAWVPSSGGQGAFWQWSGTAWVDTSTPGLQESWQLWYDEQDGGYDSATTAGYVGWQYVTSTFGADQTTAAGYGNSYGTAYGS